MVTSAGYVLLVVDRQRALCEGPTGYYDEMAHISVIRPYKWRNNTSKFTDKTITVFRSHNISPLQIHYRVQPPGLNFGRRSIAGSGLKRTRHQQSNPTTSRHSSSCCSTRSRISMVLPCLQVLIRIQCLFFALFTILVCCTTAFVAQERSESVALKRSSAVGSFRSQQLLLYTRTPFNQEQQASRTSTRWTLNKKQHFGDRTSRLVLQQSTRRNVSTTGSPPIGEPSVPTTLRQALQVFFFGRIYHGPRTIVAALLGLVTCRGMLHTTFSPIEVGVACAMVLFWCLQEHVLHQRFLHSEKDWRGKRIHQRHHERDYFHISIDPAPLMISWMSIVGIGLFWLLPTHELALTATIAYASAGLWYEWTHFIVHTKVRFPKNSYFDSCKTHHARHHLVNHNHWLAFSYPGVDDWFGTNPSVKRARNEAKQHADRRSE
jgi:hypothetical protein